VLLHGDAHVGNSYVDAAGRPALLDWQCVSTGGWAYDVAYYLASALTVEDRRVHERHLLAAYAACLAASGGPVVTADAALTSYTAYLSYGFLVWLANSTSFQPERFNALVASRFAEAMLDHGMAG
jgi:aminoglycoside phosphotransferase (APT) family kinase protein